MNASFAVALLAATLAVSPMASPNADAAVYGGSITQTVLQTNDPAYHVGQVFHGYYRYTSLTPNVEFEQFGDELLDLEVYSTLPGRAGPHSFYMATHAYFGVADGRINVFYYVLGDEWRIFYLNGGDFYSLYERWMEDPPADAILTSGHVVVSAPQRLDVVPETPATALLLGGFLLLPLLPRAICLKR